MSFLSVLKTIGTDVEKGLGVAAPILKATGAIPLAGPILVEIGTVIGNLESQNATVSSAELSAIIQAVAAAAASKPSGSTPAPAAVTTPAT